MGLNSGPPPRITRWRKPKESKMSTFNERETAFEAKFAHDEEMQFKAEARRNKLLGIWAAGLLGKSDSERDEYIKEVIRSDFEEAGDEDVYRKLAKDLEGRAGEDEIRRKMQECMAEAKSQLLDEA